MIKLLTLSRNRNFLRLWLAQLISQFGDRIHQLALVGLIAERSPGSALGLAKLLAFTILPVFVVQPFAGVLVDRMDRRTVLFICDIVRGLLVLCIPFIFMRWNTIVPIYVIVFLVFCFSRFYVPAKMSIIPDLVAEHHLLQANSLITTTGMIAFVLGAALGGFLIEEFGARNGFFIDAFTFLISAILLFNMKLQWKMRIKEKIFDTRFIMQRVRKSVFVELKEGIQYLVSLREIRFIIAMLFVLLAAAGAIYVVLIVFIQNSFHTITRDLGVLAVCLGIGLFLGVILYGKYGKHVLWYRMIFFCLFAGGLMLMIFALIVHFYPNIITAMVLSGMLGLIVGPVFIASNTIVHVVSNEEMRGKVFSALEIVIHFAFLTTMLFSSWLTQFIPPVWILTIVGFIISFIGFSGLVVKHKLIAIQSA